MEKVTIVGVTGPTGSGKSTLRAIADEFACVWIDCDIIAREILLPGKPALYELAEQFGKDIINSDGSLNRALLAQRAFATEEGRTMLNSITHPRVLERLRELCSEFAQDGIRRVVIDAPLLFEGGVDAMCDLVVAVIADRNDRLERIIRRDGITEEQAMLRMNAQPADDFYSSRAEYTIFNNGDREDFVARARSVFDEIFACGSNE